MRFSAILLAILLFFAPAAYAANTITYAEGTFTITISAIDSDWTWTETLTTKGQGVRLHSIRFNPGAANDRCVIKAGSDSGGDLFDSSVAQDTGGATIQYYPPNIRLKPVLDFSDGTYNAAAKVTIIILE